MAIEWPIESVTAKLLSDTLTDLINDINEEFSKR